MKLATHLVEKPWGRHDLPVPFNALPGAAGKQIGEIWFEPQDSGASRQELLIKYIFTSERLSVQVHPDDVQGRARGLSGGKSECWYILAADEGATLGLGTKQPLSPDELRAAALDGSIEQLMDWKQVSAGDFFFVPAGTVHAVGAGISVIEVQQNVDVTYRLYDYGRPRELHLDDGVSVAVARPYPKELMRHIGADSVVGVDQMLVDCPQFSVIYSCDLETTRRELNGRQLWVIPLSGSVSSSGDRAVPGECLWIAADQDVSVVPGTTALVGAGVNGA